MENPSESVVASGLSQVLLYNGYITLCIILCLYAHKFYMYTQSIYHDIEIDVLMIAVPWYYRQRSRWLPLGVVDWI